MKTTITESRVRQLVESLGLEADRPLLRLLQAMTPRGRERMLLREQRRQQSREAARCADGASARIQSLRATARRQDIAVRPGSSALARITMLRGYVS